MEPQAIWFNFAISWTIFKKKKKKKTHQHQVSLQTEYCRKCPYDFDITALNVGLTQIPLIHNEKIYTARNSREKSWTMRNRILEKEM